MEEQAESRYSDDRCYSPKSTDTCKTSVIPNTVLKAMDPDRRPCIGKEEGVEVDKKGSHLEMMSSSLNAGELSVQSPTTNETVQYVSEQSEIYSEDERLPESQFNNVNDCNSDKVPGFYQESSDALSFTDECPSQEGSEENSSLEDSLPYPVVDSEDGQNELNGPSLDDSKRPFYDEIIPSPISTLEVTSRKPELCNQATQCALAASEPIKSQDMQNGTEDPNVVDTKANEIKENEESVAQAAQELNKPELEDKEVLFSSTGKQTFPEATSGEERQGSHVEKEQSSDAFISLEHESIGNAVMHSENGPNKLNGPSLGDDECTLDEEISRLSTSSTPTSEVTSSEPELSDSAMWCVLTASEAVRLQNTHSQTEDLMVTEKKRGEKNFNENDLEDEEPQAQTAPELKKTDLEQKKVLFSSTGTQTFPGARPEKELQESHAEKEQCLDALISLEKESNASIKSKELSQFPLFYKPELLMRGKQSILVLQPVLGASPNATSLEFGNQKNITGADENQIKGILPIVFPVASPNIDKATRESIFHQLKIGSAASSIELNNGEEGGFEKVPLSLVKKLPTSDMADSIPVISKDDTPSSKKGGMTEEPPKEDESSSAAETSENPVEVVEDLPEWIPASELEKAFSAAEQEIVMSGSNLSSITSDQSVTFPTTTLPSTNPFAQDLALQDQEPAVHTLATKEDTVPEVSDHYSLFKPPYSPKLSPGARPKENKAMTEAGNTGNPFHHGTNPFAPDLPSKKHGQRLEPLPVHATEVVVAADSHAETIKEPYMSHQRQLSDNSMVTLIETPTVNPVLSPCAVDRQPEAAPISLKAHELSKTQLCGKDAGTAKPKKELPGTVAPVWLQDQVCTRCMHCDTKFTLVRRKHHCRICGKIFCHSCCSQLARLPYLEYSIGRICVSCTELIREAIKDNGYKGVVQDSRGSKQSPRTTQAVTARATGKNHPDTNVSVGASLARQNSPKGLIPQNQVSNSSLQHEHLPTQIAQPRQLSDTSQHQLVQKPSGGPYQLPKASTGAPQTVNQSEQLQLVQKPSGDPYQLPKAFTEVPQPPKQSGKWVQNPSAAPHQQARLIPQQSGQVYGTQNPSAAPHQQARLIPQQSGQVYGTQNPSVGNKQLPKQPIQPRQLPSTSQTPSLLPQQYPNQLANPPRTQSKSVQPSQLPRQPTRHQQLQSPSAQPQLMAKPGMVPYQLFPNAIAPPQMLGTQVPPVNQVQQGAPVSQGNQIMLVPAAPIQQNMPLFYMNPAAPSVQGGPVFLTYPQQMPFALIPNQPATTQTSKPVMRTVSSSSQRNEGSASAKSSFDTTTTFSVLPQNVGESAVKKAQKQNNRGFNQSSATYHNSVPGSQFVASAGVVQQGTGHHTVTEATRQNTESVTRETSHNHTPHSKVSSMQQESGHPHFEKTDWDAQSDRTKKTDSNGRTAKSHASVSSSGSSCTGNQIPAFISSSVSTMCNQPPPTSSTPCINSTSVPSAEGSAKPAVDPVYDTSPTEQISSLRPSNLKKSEGSILAVDVDPSEGDLKPPFRKAGRTASWRYRTQSKSKLQEQRKSLARDLKDLPNGITVRASANFFIHVKRMKLKERENNPVNVWCFQSEGLNKFDQLEVVFLLEIKRKEDVFPEEVLRVFRAIMYFAKLGDCFQHCNYLSSNDPFLDSSDDAAFVFVSSEVKPKPAGLRQLPAPFLYSILVKRSELSAAMFTPSRFLLRLGQEMNCYPFPLWNPRDRKAIHLGNEKNDRIFHTVFAMNKYLKNSFPEAMIPGLYVVKESNKVVLQVPHSGQKMIVSLLDRLVVKENQTATVPIVADAPDYADHCKVVVCSDLGRSVVPFANPAVKTKSTGTSVIGLGFVLLHLGVDASSPLSYGGELLDDGVLIFFSKTHSQKLRQSVNTKTNCYFYLGDNFDIAHFELRWIQDTRCHEIPQAQKGTHVTSTLRSLPASSAVATETGADVHPGLTTVHIQHAGYRNEEELLKKVFEDPGKILRTMEGNIREACTTPLMKHANKMPSGVRQELQLRVVLRPSYKKWSVGPSNLSTGLIRSLQMALARVRMPEVFEGELVMNFNVTVLKQ